MICVFRCVRVYAKSREPLGSDVSSLALHKRVADEPGFAEMHNLKRLLEETGGLSRGERLGAAGSDVS